MNLKFETIVQIFRKIIQLIAVVILKNTNKWHHLYPGMVQKEEKGGWGGGAIFCRREKRGSRPVADPETSEMGEGGGARNMKYKSLRMAAIFFITVFLQARGVMAPLAPPLDPLLVDIVLLVDYHSGVCVKEKFREDLRHTTMH